MFIVTQDGSLLNTNLIQKIYIESGSPCKLIAEYDEEEDIILEGTEDACEVARRKLIRELETIRLDDIAPDLGTPRN